MATSDRYKVLSDDSGHEYWVKVGDEDAFYAWAEDIYQDEDHPYDFEDNRIEGSFTFTDPRNG